jgi:catechol 2,3-dioxygenase-like lactoylglutathione lyase family enzyme
VEAVVELGAFSVSLAVADLAVSRRFYEALGFEVVGGSAEENYLMMRNGRALVGLFQGMFEANILTFTPGWDENAEAVPGFSDVRAIQQHLLDQGIALDSEVAPDSTGPGYLTLTDPDGNAILIDQHVD